MSRARAVPRILARRGDLVVERDPRRPSGRLLRCGDMDASYVDLADPGHLEFDYLRWMRKVLGAARARRVLHVGGGACALARTLAAADPGGRQEVCEIDPHVLALAREHCGLRRAPGLHVRQADGRAFIAVQPDASWDAVVIDAFVGAVLPPRLITAQALLDVARVARLALVNVVDDRPAHVVRAVAGGLAAAYPRVWGLGARAGNNTVVVGCAADLDLDLDRIAADAAADPSPARLTAPAAMTRLMSGSPALRDEGLTALAASAPRTLTAPAASAPRTTT
ncbi:MAG: fused MFS/spermidine synthase [Solirubrobacterales bacterium]|nr:fused MFS/spermidine synthase [Solirubrobacterales bacterium]MBV9717577.1 fused MFS/spermidine synthase [Solirubrobacterales bacterium]